MKIQAVSDKVLLELIPADTHTAGGIEIPEEFRGNAEAYLVRSVGPKVKHLHGGNRVVTTQHKGEPFNIDGTQFVFVKEEDVLAVL